MNLPLDRLGSLILSEPISIIRHNNYYHGNLFVGLLKSLPTPLAEGVEFNSFSNSTRSTQ